MKRVLVIGNCGAGKTYFTKQLSEKTGIPSIHLDEFYWLPQWEAQDTQIFETTLNEQLAKPTWIMDGNYNATMSKRLEHADSIIHLDYNRFKCCFQIFKRWFQKERMTDECTATINYKFILYVLWRYPRHMKPKIANIKKAFPHRNWISFKSQQESQEWLNALNHASNTTES